MGGDPPDQARLRQLAEEQAALRRVATLVARGTPPEQVFAAVAEEIGHLLSVDVVNMCRYDPDRTITFLASWDSAGQRFPVRSRLSLGGHNLGTLVYETGCSGRIESYADDSSIGAVTVESGVRSAVGTPITVEGRVWGVISAGTSLVQPLPPGAEERLASFTELVATAIANADSRAALARLAEEQAALRRWWRAGRRRSRYSRRSPRSTRGWFRSMRRPWRAWSLTVRSSTSPAGAGQWTSFPSVAGGPRTGRTSPRPCWRPAGRSGSRARPVPPARSPISSVTWASARWSRHQD